MPTTTHRGSSMHRIRRLLCNLALLCTVLLSQVGGQTQASGTAARPALGDSPTGGHVPSGLLLSAPRAATPPATSAPLFAATGTPAAHNAPVTGIATPLRGWRPVGTTPPNSLIDPRASADASVPDPLATPPHHGASVRTAIQLPWLRWDPVARIAATVPAAEPLSISAPAVPTRVRPRSIVPMAPARAGQGRILGQGAGATESSGPIRARRFARSAAGGAGAGYALQFDAGRQTYARIPDSPGLEVSGAFTIEAWIYQTNASPHGYRLFDKETSGIGDGYNFDTYDMGDARSGRRLRLCGVTCVNGTTTYSLNQWHHVAVTVSGTTATFFLDGQPDGGGDVGTIQTNHLDVLIGNSHLGCGGTCGGVYEYFNGTIDEVRLWDVARTRQQIDTTLGTALAGNEPGLVGYWPFDDGSGTSAADTSGNGHAATLVNGPAWVASSAPIAPAGAADFSAYAHHLPLTIAGGDTAVGGSITTPVATNGTDYVVQLHLTGSQAAQIYGGAAYDATTTLNGAPFADVTAWWRDGAGVQHQLDTDYDTSTHGPWGTDNVTLWFRLQRPLGAAPATDIAYTLAWGNASPAVLRDWANIYPLQDDFAGSSLDAGTWTTAYEQAPNIGPGTASVGGGLLTISASAANQVVNSVARFGPGYVVNFRQTLPPSTKPYHTYPTDIEGTGNGLFTWPSFPYLGISVGNDDGGGTGWGFRYNLDHTVYNYIPEGPASADLHTYALARSSSGEAFVWRDGDTPSDTGVRSTASLGALAQAASYNSDTVQTTVDWVKVRPWILGEPVVSAAAGTIALDTCTLPGAQGWTYAAFGNAATESTVFSTSGCVLHQNTMGIGFVGQGDNVYSLPGVVDPHAPFTLSFRVRVVAYENGPRYPAPNSFGFFVAASTGAEDYDVAIEPHRIADANQGTLSTAIDGTQFHDYRLEVTPGTGYRLYVDDALLATGRPSSGGPDGLSLGDGTGGANARADIASLSFTQAQPGTTATGTATPSDTTAPSATPTTTATDTRTQTNTATQTPIQTGTATTTATPTSSAKCAAWDLAADFLGAPTQANPNPDSCGTAGVWSFMQANGQAHDPSSYSLLTKFTSASNGEQIWGSGGGAYPYVAKNTGNSAVVDGYSVSWPAGTVGVEPNIGQLGLVSWRSPVTGTVSIRGSIGNIGYGCGDGVHWSIEAGGATLAGGGWGEQTAPQSVSNPFDVPSVAVSPGSMVYFVIDPGGSNTCDETALAIQIAVVASPSTGTATATDTPADVATPSATDTSTGTATVSVSSTKSSTPTSTGTASGTATPTPTLGNIGTPTQTPTASATLNPGRACGILVDCDLTAGRWSYDFGPPIAHVACPAGTCPYNNGGGFTQGFTAPASGQFCVVGKVSRLGIINQATGQYQYLGNADYNGTTCTGITFVQGQPGAAYWDEGTGLSGEFGSFGASDMYLRDTSIVPPPTATPSGTVTATGTATLSSTTTPTPTQTGTDVATPTGTPTPNPAYRSCGLLQDCDLQSDPNGPIWLGGSNQYGAHCHYAVNGVYTIACDAWHAYQAITYDRTGTLCWSGARPHQTRSHTRATPPGPMGPTPSGATRRRNRRGHRPTSTSATS